MSIDVRIRPMRENDLPQIMVIERESYSTPWPESSFRGLLGRSDTALFVAEATPGEEGDGGEVDEGARGEIVGYAVCWAVLGQGELGNIAVGPRWRHQGVARRLLERVIEAMRELSVKELFLEVRLSNTVAQHLYRSYDFHEVGLRRGYYSNPTEDALVMRKMLA